MEAPKNVQTKYFRALEPTDVHKLVRAALETSEAHYLMEQHSNGAYLFYIPRWEGLWHEDRVIWSENDFCLPKDIGRLSCFYWTHENWWIAGFINSYQLWQDLCSHYATLPFKIRTPEGKLLDVSEQDTVYLALMY